MSDPYQVLGVSPGASLDEIRQAYWEQVRAHPPERDPEAFKRIRAAYEQLVSLADQDPLFRLQTPPEWTVGRIGASIDADYHPQDALTALQAWGDLGREDFEDDLGEVSL
jgi:hypothetical protein